MAGLKPERWPASARNGGRDQIGGPAGIKSEQVAGLRRYPHAFLLLDRNPRRIDLSFQRRRPLELLACPELDCRQSEWKPLGGYDET